MEKALLWVRYGFCTCLGLALIGLAAVYAVESDPGTTPDFQPDLAPPT